MTELDSCDQRRGYKTGELSNNPLGVRVSIKAGLLDYLGFHSPVLTEECCFHCSPVQTHVRQGERRLSPACLSSKGGWHEWTHLTLQSSALPLVHSRHQEGRNVRSPSVLLQLQYAEGFTHPRTKKGTDRDIDKHAI